MNKICIIVGHGKSKSGGYDSGAVSKDGKTHEFKVAKEIAKHCVDYLNANYDVKADLMNYDGSLYLTDRIKAVNKADYDFIAEIHLNAGGGKGTETYYYHGSPTGLKVATEISKGIAKEFGVPDRGAKVRLNDNGKDYFAIIRDTKPTAILVETLFIDNNAEVAILKTADGQKRCGIEIAKGIAKGKGLKAVTKSATTTETVKKPVVNEKPAEKPDKLYRVCVGAYAVKSNADAMKAGLEKLGFDAYIVEV